MPVCMPVLIERDNNGYLNLKTNTPGATVHYSLNGGEEKIYTEPSNLFLVVMWKHMPFQNN